MEKLEEKKINNTKGQINDLSKKQIYVIAKGAFSLVITLFLVFSVLEIGKSTSFFGDQFGVQKIFRITNTDDGTLYNIRTKSSLGNINKKTFKNGAQIGDLYLFKGRKNQNDITFIEVNPINVKRESQDSKGALNAISTEQIEERRNKFGDKSGYISENAGEVLTPFQYNVQRFLEENKINIGKEKYTLGLILKRFSARSSTYYIYHIMSILLLCFIYFYWKRLIFLFNSYASQQKVEQEIFKHGNLNSRTLNKFIQKDYKDTPHQFIKRLHSSFKVAGDKSQFNNIYREFVNEAEQRDDNTIYNLKNCNVWIIRAGIFGTLVGLIIAFLELYIGMGFLDVENFKISKEFIGQLQSALLGNAMAIATSITAHGSSLAIEVFLITLISGESNKDWIEKTYLEMVTLKLYQPRIKSVVQGADRVNDLVEDLSIEFQNTTMSLKEFASSAVGSNGLIKRMNETLEKINVGLSNIDTDLSETKHFTEAFKNTSSQIYKKTDEAKSLINNAALRMEEVKKQADDLTNYLKRKMGLIKISASDTINKSQLFIKMVAKKLESLRDNINQN